MKLVICEKPSVAKFIASALGVTSRADGCFEGEWVHRFLVRRPSGVPDGRGGV